MSSQPNSQKEKPAGRLEAAAYGASSSRNTLPAENQLFSYSASEPQSLDFFTSGLNLLLAGQKVLKSDRP
jgi:hypothetical protein